MYLVQFAVVPVVDLVFVHFHIVSVVDVLLCSSFYSWYSCRNTITKL